MAVAGNDNQLRYAQISDIGCVRQLNEDSVFGSEGLWLVADGMGGHACGDVASRLAIDTIVSAYRQKHDLVGAIERAHHQILAIGEQDLAQKGMGTTIVALACKDDQFEVAWVGDSRAYLWQPENQSLTQLTNDHSFVVEMVRQGLLSSAEAKSHPKRNVITRCLGSTSNLRFAVDTRLGKWQQDEQILLCSDGLSDELNSEEIAEILASGKDLQETLQTLVAKVKQVGGKDNISAVLVAYR